MTLSTNVKSIQARLRTYGQQAIVRAKAATAQSAERSYQTSHALAPVDTGFMVDHLVKEIAPNGLGYEVGFHDEDFPGEFYPLHVVFGTRFMPARDFLFGPNQGERVRYRRALVEALSPSRGVQPPSRQ